MKKVCSLLLLLVSITVKAQVNIPAQYEAAVIMLKQQEPLAAYKLLKQIEPLCQPADTIYSDVLWRLLQATSAIAEQYKFAGKPDSALVYDLENLAVLEKGKEVFPEGYNGREFWTHKNLLVSYFVLQQYDKAKKEREILYAAYKKNALPDGLNKHFNYDFFKWNDKNVWGYEWYEELPKDRFSKSFSKVVYYVYSTHPDGSDKEQLYRLHVLMFHNIDKRVKIDYVLTLMKKTEQGEQSRTLYSYTYKEDINYEKLRADIKAVLQQMDEGGK